MQINDPYKTLGVSKDASQEDIKQAYRKLAKQWHPDVNKDPEAEQKFKEISSAYDIVGDPEKRKKHDHVSVRFDQFSNFGFDDFLNQFRREKPKGRNLRAAIEMSLEDSIKGGLHRISIPKREACQGCMGTGAKDLEFVTCNNCSGSGFVSNETAQRGIFFRTQYPCPSCSGHGRISKYRCDKCDGSGITENIEHIEIDIPAGISNSDIVRIKGQGENGTGGPGDLQLLIKIRPHPMFQREGDVLYGKMDVPFLIALKGGNMELEYLFGEKIWIDIPKSFKYGHEVVVPGKGVKGDPLIVRLYFELPVLKESQINKIAEAIS